MHAAAVFAQAAKQHCIVAVVVVVVAHCTAATLPFTYGLISISMDVS